MHQEKPTSTHTNDLIDAIEASLADYDELLVEEDTARILHRRPKTLRKWRCTGEVQLPYTKVGGRILYFKKGLIAAVRAGLRK